MLSTNLLTASYWEDLTGGLTSEQLNLLDELEGKFNNRLTNEEEDTWNYVKNWITIEENETMAEISILDGLNVENNRQSPRPNESGCVSGCDSDSNGRNLWCTRLAPECSGSGRRRSNATCEPIEKLNEYLTNLPILGYFFC